MNIVKLEYISQVAPDKTMDLMAPVDKNILEFELGTYIAHSQKEVFSEQHNTQ